MNKYEILKNYQKIKARIKKACERANRRAEDIKIVAVSKTVDVEVIDASAEAGINIFGESRVQELIRKIEMCRGNYEWHMIGRLQKNKVKYIVDKVKLIHSVDSIDLAKEINIRAEKANRIVDVLLQVNIAEESTKAGFSKNNLLEAVNTIKNMFNVKVKGLMTIAPYVDNPEEIRWVFAEMKNLYVDLKTKNIDNISMEYLSMGMSNDFEVAIEEGANIVRIGTAIFGERFY